MATRADIQRCARTYVETPYAYQGRQKGKGIDCGGLIYCIGLELGLVPAEADDRAYTRRPGDFITHKCEQFLVAKRVQDLQPGDVATLRFPGAIHAAIVTEVHGVLYIIHSFGKKCVEHILDARWRSHIVGAYTFPGVTD
jgi:cell wall-associated NlpC family hydrolase